MILGVPYDASKPEIKEAFIKLSKTLHPDVNTSVNASEEFQRVKSAYDVLMNSKHTDTAYSSIREEGFYHQPSSEEWRQWRSRQKRTKEFDDWMKNVANERRQGRDRRRVKEDNFDFNEGWMGWGWEKPSEKRTEGMGAGKREAKEDRHESSWGWEKLKKADEQKEEMEKRWRNRHRTEEFKRTEEPFIKFVDLMFCMPMAQIPQHSVVILKLMWKVAIVLTLIAVVGISYEIKQEMNFDSPYQKEARPEYVEAVKPKSGTLSDL